MDQYFVVLTRSVTILVNAESGSNAAATAKMDLILGKAKPYVDLGWKTEKVTIRKKGYARNRIP